LTNRHTLRARRSGPPATLVAVGILLVAIVGGMLLLHASGVIEIPLLTGAKEEPPPRIDMRGKVLVPMSARTILAYSAVSQSDLFDVRTGNIRSYPMRKEHVPEGTMLDLQALLGRVLKRDHPAGQIFLESEFYPRGTRPGPTAGVPPGKRAMRLNSSAIPGLHGLNQGDRFDIVMTREVEIEEPRATTRSSGGARVPLEGPYAPLHAAERETPAAPPLPTVKRRYAEVELVVEDGLLVMPIHQRQEIGMKAAGLLSGPKLQQKPVEELIIAVNPSEVSALNRAMALQAHLQVAMRSGQVESDSNADEGHIPEIVVDPAAIAPQPEGADGGEGPEKHYRMVEVIVGGKKQLISIPVEKKPEAETEDEPK
jgi:Flp pilus assembly protein CpaB